MCFASCGKQEIFAWAFLTAVIIQTGSYSEVKRREKRREPFQPSLS